MTALMDQQRFSRVLTLQALLFCGMLLQAGIATLALWRAGRFQEQVRWTAIEVGFSSFCFFIAGMVLMARTRRVFSGREVSA